MTHRPLPRTLAIGVAGIGIVTALAGCSAATTASVGSASSTDPTASEPSAGSTDSSASDASGAASTTSTYTDGTYTEDGSYVSPGGKQSITVKLTLVDDKVTAVTVTGHATDSTAKGYQSQFIGGISDVVVGKDIDSLNVSRVAGSSLTSGGFNAALKAVKADAS